MQIIIGYEINELNGKVIGTHVFESDPAIRRCSHPTRSEQQMNPAEYIELLRDDSDMREKAGWHVITKHSDERVAMSKWDRLVAHTNSESGCPLIKKVIGKV